MYIYQAPLVYIYIYMYICMCVCVSVYKNVTRYIEASSHKIVAVRLTTSHLKNYRNEMRKTCRTLVEK